MLDDRLAVALQRGLPLCPRPFESLADELGCSEADLIGCVARLRDQGLCRRFGAVFDTRRLGYRSALCAAAVPEEGLAEAAAKVTPLEGVTHCYERAAPADAEFARLAPGDGPRPNRWFTLSSPADVFPAMADEVRARLRPFQVHVLPALRRYKIDVVFGASSRAADERVEDDLPPLGAFGRALVGAVQGDTEVRPDYFAGIAEALGAREWDVLSTLEMWRRNGRLRRIGLLLRHREAGWTANGMCCWRVEGDTTVAGRALAERGEVSHCYERPEAPGFPYNLFAMVHERSMDGALASFQALDAHLAASLGAPPPGVMLASTREFKKTSMKFFEGGRASR